MRFFVGLVALLVCACGASAATGTTTSSGATPTATVQELPHPPQPDAAKAYPIHMARALHVGQRMHFVSDAEEARTTTMTRQGSVIDKKKVLNRMHLDAVGTVMSLDAKQDALRATYAVSDLSASGDKAKSLLHNQKLDVTRAKKEDDAIVLVDGAPATAEIREALKMVMSLRTGGPSDDEVFGSKEPRAVGAHWSIDAQRAHDDLVSDQGESMANAVIDGDVTVAGLGQAEGVNCLELKSDLHMKNIAVPAAPAGSTVVEGKATAHFEGLFPIDETIPRLTDRLTLTMSIKLEVTTPGGSILVSVDGVNKHDRHMTPLNP